MGKAVKGISKTASRVGKKVGGTVKRVTDIPGIKTIKKGARAITAGTAGIATLGLLPEGGKALGIKSKLGKLAYRGGGNVGKAAALVAGGAALAPAFAGAGAGSGSGLLSGLGGKLAGFGGKALTGLAGQALTGLMGGGGQGGGLQDLAGLYGGFQAYRGQEKAMDDLSNLEGRYMGNIGRQEELAGLDPVVAAQMKHQASQDLRASQAERGIEYSGVGAAQEAELMPRIDQQQKSWQLQQLAAINPQYAIPMETSMKRAGMYDMGEQFGGAMAGPAGAGGGGGSNLLNMAGKWGSNLLGGVGSQFFSRKNQAFEMDLPAYEDYYQ